MSDKLGNSVGNTVEIVSAEGVAVGVSDKLGYSVGSTLVDVSVDGVAVAMLPPNGDNVWDWPVDGNEVVMSFGGNGVDDGCDGAVVAVLTIGLVDGVGAGERVVDVEVDGSLDGVVVAVLSPTGAKVGGLPNDGKPVILFARIGAIVDGATDGCSVNAAGDGVNDVGGEVAGSLDDGDADG